MAEGGFFSRLSNLWQGFLSVFMGNLEKDNPEAVYEAAINARKEQYKELKKAVSGIIVLRNKLAAELEEKSKKIKDLDLQIATAVETEEDKEYWRTRQKGDLADPGFLENFHRDDREG